MKKYRQIIVKIKVCHTVSYFVSSSCVDQLDYTWNQPSLKFPAIETFSAFRIITLLIYDYHVKLCRLHAYMFLRINDNFI